MATKLDRTLVLKTGEFRQNLSHRLLKIDVCIILALADSFLEKNIDIFKKKSKIKDSLAEPGKIVDFLDFRKRES
jgi:hypothetical protein